MMTNPNYIRPEVPLPASQLFLEDLEGSTDAEVREYINDNFGGTAGGRLAPEELDDRFDILIAYVSVGNYGCDSSAFFLLRERSTGKLFENHGSHCSCYGFEGQWKPEETTLDYLRSSKFYFSTGGYDNEGKENVEQARAYIAKL